MPRRLGAGPNSSPPPLPSLEKCFLEQRGTNVHLRSLEVLHGRGPRRRGGTSPRMPYAGRRVPPPGAGAWEGATWRQL